MSVYLASESFSENTHKYLIIGLSSCKISLNRLYKIKRCQLAICWSINYIGDGGVPCIISTKGVQIGSVIYLSHNTTRVSNSSKIWLLCARHCVRPGDQFHKKFMKYWLKSCQNYFCCNFVCNDTSMSKFCICHDSSAVVACAKFWLDYFIIFHTRAAHIFIRFGLWAHKPFVKWVAVGGGGCGWSGLVKLVSVERTRPSPAPGRWWWAQSRVHFTKCSRPVLINAGPPVCHDWPPVISPLHTYLGRKVPVTSLLLGWHMYW